MNVRANLEYGYRIVSPSLRHFQPAEVVRLMELENLLDRWPGQLSGGEAQRVVFGRSILASPRILLLDEPMSSLDRRLRQQITPFLRRIRDATAIPMLYVSHNLRDILDLTDRLAVLDCGRLIGHGPLSDLVADSRVLDLLEQDSLASALPLTVVQREADHGVTSFRCASHRGDHQVCPPVPETGGGG
jgi:molybdate transport system ATP-binding protein